MNKNNIFAGFTLLLILGVATVGVIGAGGFSPFADKDVDSQDENAYGMIEGNIIFENFQSSISDATVYIRLDDVSLADAPSKMISNATLENITIEMDDVVSIPYSLEHPELDERFSYTIYAHVDVDGDGKVSKGDYVTTMHNPVNTTETDQAVDATVSPVGVDNDDTRLQPSEMEGTVKQIRDDDKYVSITVSGSQSEDTVFDEIVLTVGNETVIFDGSGAELSVDDIEVGSDVRVYYGPIMTMSIPPISPAVKIVVLSDEQLQPLEMNGTVKEIRNDENSVSITVVDRESTGSSLDEIVLTIGDGVVIENKSGTQLSIDEIEVGSQVKAYYGPMMTRSIPPISPATRIVYTVP